MRYRLLLRDIDGTLRPHMKACVPAENAAAIRAVQAIGIKFVVATGRGRGAISDELLSAIRPDYWICAAGSQVLDSDGRELYRNAMSEILFYSLLEFCDRYGCPLLYAFSDATYAYIGYQNAQKLGKERRLILLAKNGEDRTRHLRDMPFSAAGFIPRSMAKEFQEAHPEFNLRFLYYREDYCDILRTEQDKSVGLDALLAHESVLPEECICVGDGDNDIGMFRKVGRSFCVADGTQLAQNEADEICPSASQNGVASVCRTIWPEINKDFITTFG